MRRQCEEADFRPVGGYVTSNDGLYMSTGCSGDSTGARKRRAQYSQTRGTPRVEGFVDSLTNRPPIWRQRGLPGLRTVGCGFRYIPHTNLALTDLYAGGLL